MPRRWRGRPARGHAGPEPGHALGRDGVDALPCTGQVVEGRLVRGVGMQPGLEAGLGGRIQPVLAAHQPAQGLGLGGAQVREFGIEGIARHALVLPRPALSGRARRVVVGGGA